MAILLMDSFGDSYTAMSQRWPIAPASESFSTSYGRFGTNGLRCTYAQHSGLRSLGNEFTTVYAGIAARFSSMAAKRTPLRFALGNLTQVIIVIETSGKLYAYRGDLSASLGNSTLTVDATAYHYYEAMVTCSDSAGQVIINVDGVNFLTTATNLDTSMQTSNFIDHVGFGGQTGACNCDYDDMYVDDAGFLGDCHVETRVPTGAGNYSQWSPSAGSNYACVDEIPVDTDDYVSDTAAGTIDTYTKAALSSTEGAVKGVAAYIYCQKTGPGFREIAIATRLSSTDDVGDGIPVPSSWGWVVDIKQTKPGGGAWSISDFDNTEIGQKLVT